MMKNLSKKFDSLTAFSSWLNNTPVAGYYAENNVEYSKDADNESNKFTGTPDYETADNIMLSGWMEGADRVRAAMIKSAGGTAEKARLYNSVVGFAPNVARYVQGHPLNMINKKRVRVPARVVEIIYDSIVACNITAAQIETAAAKLFNVVAGLEKNGVRVNLWALSTNAGNDQNASFAVKIKSADQPFNLLKMVYPVVHPSFLRRHGFAFLERSGVTGTHSDWKCYGRVIKDFEKKKKLISHFGLSGKNLFDYYSISGKSEKEIAEMIK